MSYTSDRAWSDAYIPALRQIVGPLLLVEAPLDLDTSQATDLIVLIARDMRIGCRVRKPGYADRYPWDFTIRSRRESGTTTELAKIIEGWGDWLVYAHATDSARPQLDRWFVIDLDAFRASLIRGGYVRHQTRTSETANGDGTYFVHYDVRRVPQNLIVRASHVTRDKSATCA